MPSKRGPVYCDYEGCKKPFRDLRDLRRHQRIHGETREFQCPFTSEGCKYKGSHQLDGLNRHMNSIHYKVRIQCPFEGCEKDYSDPSTVHEHMINAHDYKPQTRAARSHFPVHRQDSYDGASVAPVAGATELPVPPSVASMSTTDTSSPSYLDYSQTSSALPDASQTPISGLSCTDSLPYLVPYNTPTQDPLYATSDGAFVNNLDFQPFLAGDMLGGTSADAPPFLPGFDFFASNSVPQTSTPSASSSSTPSPFYGPYPSAPSSPIPDYNLAGTYSPMPDVFPSLFNSEFGQPLSMDQPPVFPWDQSEFSLTQEELDNFTSGEWPADV